MVVEAKICGLTRADDAAFAVAHGAARLGVVFAGGPREVSIATAAEIVAAAGAVPVMAVVGPRDAENGTVSVRIRGVQNDLGQMALDAFVSALAEEYRSRGATMLSEKFGK